MHCFLSLIPVLFFFVAFGQRPSKITDLSDEMRETSGLLMINGNFYTINDSGGEAELYKIDTLSGQVAQRIKVEGATNQDWEALTTDGEYIYIGDIGNNWGNRKDLVIYKCPVSGLSNGVLEASEIKLSYEDQDDFEHKPHTHEYDGEGLFVRKGELYLISKNWAKDVSKIYRIPTEPGEYKLTKVAKLDVYGKVTDAYFDEAENSLFLIGYGKDRFITYLRDFNGKKAQEEITVPIKLMSGLQTEGIWVHNGIIYYTSEEVKIFKAELSRFFLKDFNKIVAIDVTNKDIKISSIHKIETITIETKKGKNLAKYSKVDNRKKKIKLADFDNKDSLYIRVELKSGVIVKKKVNLD